MGRRAERKSVFRLTPVEQEAAECLRCGLTPSYVRRVYGREMLKRIAEKQHLAEQLRAEGTPYSQRVENRHTMNVIAQLR